MMSDTARYGIDPTDPDGDPYLVPRPEGQWMKADEALQRIRELEEELNHQTLMLEESRAENERLREDAERYRWLCEDSSRIIYTGSFFKGDGGKADIDAAIDAARGQDA